MLGLWQRERRNFGKKSFVCETKGGERNTVGIFLLPDDNSASDYYTGLRARTKALTKRPSTALARSSGERVARELAPL